MNHIKYYTNGGLGFKNQQPSFQIRRNENRQKKCLSPPIRSGIINTIGVLEIIAFKSATVFQNLIKISDLYRLQDIST